MLLFSIGDIKNLWLLLVLSFFAELRLPVPVLSFLRGDAGI